MSFWKNLLFKSFGFLFGKDTKNTESSSKQLMICDLRNDSDFALSVVALAAKMAKADGIATKEEALAFDAAFPIAKEDKKAFFQIFNLASASSLGFEGYAKRIRRKHSANKELLYDVLTVLFFVAAADGHIKESEKEFLKNVCKNLGLTDYDYSKIAIHFLDDEPINPYVLLGVNENDSDAIIKNAWLKIVSENHPDIFIGRGVPKEFIKLANEKTANANRAYAQIRAMRNNGK